MQGNAHSFTAGRNGKLVLFLRKIRRHLSGKVLKTRLLLDPAILLLEI